MKRVRSDLESSGLDREELVDVDLELYAEQIYRETIHGVRSFVGWTQIPEFDSAFSSQDDNPFAGSRSSHTGKVSVKVPIGDWLCRKFEKLNLTVQECYPSRTLETAGLNMDHIVKPSKTLKWYDMHCETKDLSSSKVYTWSSKSARLHSSFQRIASHSLPSAPASQPVSLDTLKKWEQGALDQSYMCN